MLVREEDSVLEKTFRKCGKKSCLCSSAGLGKSRGVGLQGNHAIISTEPALGPTASKCTGRGWIVQWEPPLLSPPKDLRPLNNGELGSQSRTEGWTR